MSSPPEPHVGSQMRSPGLGAASCASSLSSDCNCAIPSLPVAINGSIDIKSQVGKGTTFFVELPIAQKPAAKAA